MVAQVQSASDWLYSGWNLLKKEFLTICDHKLVEH